MSNHIILGDGSGNQRLVIDDRGYTGIGTTNPDAKLTPMPTLSKTKLTEYRLTGQARNIIKIDKNNGLGY
ncbi:hypothetical protein [Mucilaginibacter polytrichastri]|uniref:Uncharacterized protein n=1 Tax=Mucilaginibacter polytrichastri TaxID=1302689 RepID=A0A1Q5ZZV4_9SPHI|nr:hypothetical protein [Mucilaginibacter polytrichastri]OKS87294.1 hypothetical protein RG47T_2753 [Mucilaginibacter polytrichastri]SFT18432.1 hypothetical protein SAMN04487890_1155 [Mucilaginibacter polytrichastri]